MYRPKHEYGEYYQSLLGCRVFRESFGPVKNDIMHSSKYGKRNDNHGLRGVNYNLRGINYSLKEGNHGFRGKMRHWDDAPRHRMETPMYSGHRVTVASKSGNVNHSISRFTSQEKGKLIIQEHRLHQLATAKKSGCGPNCKYFRCAANDPSYVVPHDCTPHERKEKTNFKRFGRRDSTIVIKSTYSTIDKIRKKLYTDENDAVTGLKKLKEVSKSKDIQFFPIIEQNCNQNCEKYLETSRDSMEEETSTETLEKQTHARHTTLRSLTTKTVACNTYGPYCEPAEVYEVPTRILKDVNSNYTTELLHKQTSPIPRVKTPISTPLPRVALLRPSRSAPSRDLTKTHPEKILYTICAGQLQPPRPKHKVPSPNPDHEAPSLCEQQATPMPQPVHEVPSLHSQNLTPLSLTSRRETYARRMQQQSTKWMFGKLSSRLLTPPMVKYTPISQTQTTSLQFQASQQQHQQTPPQLEPSQSPDLPKAQPPSPIQTLDLNSSLFASTSDFGSDNITTDSATSASKTKTGSETLTLCLCNICGKSENVSNQPNNAIYKNNPLYDLASPFQSPARQFMGTMSHNPSRSRIFTLEVLVLIVLGGILTVAFIPYAEFLLRVYVQGFCMGYPAEHGKNQGHGPQLTADGLKSGVVQWVTCPLNEGRIELR